MREEEDYIDFSCSDTWRDYYWERGLTTRPSLSSLIAIQRELKELRSELAHLTRLVGKLLTEELKPNSESNFKARNHDPMLAKNIIEEVMNELEEKRYNQKGR
ncbi:MAG: hypothetical protein QXQ53_04485 [Candidatus Methanosuratincola sp.]